jgi:phosphotransferase system enzyme I (PtsI)
VTLWLAGIGVSRGVAIGPAHRVHPADLDIPEFTLEPDAVEAEVARFEQALAQARGQLTDVSRQIPGNAPDEIAAFIETHLLMMQDSSLADRVPALIREQRLNAEWALKRQQDHLVSVFEQMDDDYLRARRDDVRHVAARIQRILLKEERVIAPRGQKGRLRPIIVADDITPADIILMHQQGVAAFVTEHGGPLSHTAILARSLRVPMIVGLHGARRLLADEETLIVDGDAGHALADAGQSALAFYRHRQRRDRRYRRMLSQLRDEPAISADGVRVRLLANVELPDDSAEAVSVGAEGIGLYRTEFLYMNRGDMPGEDEQLSAYRRVLQTVAGPVTIRTLDLGADKTAASVRQQAQATNPALGLRAIRFCLKEPDMFRVQLRALLRASVDGDLRIMIPMISNVQELQQTRRLLEQAKSELRSEGHAFNNAVALGAMIEVPAAALAAPQLARHADFFSLGTNDLIQYTLAMDRVDDEISYLYDPLHPAVLRLIQTTIDAGRAAGIPVSLCGEMGSDQRYAALLLGLGLTEFSMHPANIPEIKRLVMQSRVGELRRRVADILAGDDPATYRAQLAELQASH